jgi:PAS domain S-box-containing protein
MSPLPGYGNVIDILLIEDSEVHVELIRDSLMSGGGNFCLTTARSLTEAYRVLREMTPDLAIVDLILPDGKGVALLAPEHGPLPFPVIIMTGNGDECEAVEAMKAGALDYLVKSSETLSAIPRIIERSLRAWQHVVERRRAERDLRESEERFRSVFTNAAAGMVIISPAGEILQANQAFCRFIGHDEEELHGMSVDAITHPEDREATAHHYREVFAGKRTGLHYEKRYLHKEGLTLWGHASVAGVLDSSSSPRYCVCLVQDISERKRIEAELLNANRELDNFVHTVSHDLRSPLSPIIGYADYLRTGYGECLDEEACYMLAEIGRQGVRMLNLLEDLLALAKVGHLKRPDDPVDCNDVLEEVAERVENQLATVGLTIVRETLPSVRIPRTLLAQLFENLLVNAVHYGGGGVEPIQVGGKRQGGRVTLYVRDHGQGVPVDERNSIFNLFYRGSTGAAIQGTGVGLATVQKIARLHGGRAWVEETPGGGSTFHVEVQDAGE